MRLAVVVDTGRKDAERLSFEHRKRRSAEVEHDMPDVGRRVLGRQSEVAGDRRDRRLRRRVQVDVSLRRRPRPSDMDAGARDLGLLADFGRQLIVRRSGGIERDLLGQAVPSQLITGRIRFRLRDLMPVIDRSGRTRRHARVTPVADVEVDDVVPIVVRDRADRARRFACVAADADLGIDQVLQRVFRSGGAGRRHPAILPRCSGCQSSVNSTG